MRSAGPCTYTFKACGKDNVSSGCFPPCVQRKVTGGVTGAVTGTLAYFHRSFSLFLLFLHSCYFVCVGASPAPWANGPADYFYIRLEGPLSAANLPHQQWQQEELLQRGAFHFSLGRGTNVVTAL